MSRDILFFQLGAMAERRVVEDSFAHIDRLWRRWSPGLPCDPAHRARVKETIGASMPAPIAMYRGGGFKVGTEPIVVPTLFVVGRDDGCVLPQISNGQERLFSQKYRREIWENTGHFPHLEHPSRAAAAVVDWFSGTSPRTHGLG